MKKKLLSLAIAGASVFAAHSYAAGPTVYGKLNVSLQQIDTEDFAYGGIDGEGNPIWETVTDDDTWELRSNSSRLGVTGDYDINSDLKAIYKLEYEVYVDDGDDGAGSSSEFNQRNIYVGLQGKSWGTLLAGKHDSPLKLSQGKADQFNDMYLADITNIMVGENRMDNTIMYTTPNLGGFLITAAIAPGEQTEQDDAPDDVRDADDGIADHISIAAEFKLDALRLSAAMDSDINENDVIRLVGEFAVDAFEFGAIYQMAEANDSDLYDDDGVLITDFADYEPYDGVLSPRALVGDSEQDAWIISGAFKLNDKLKLKAQIGMSETDVSAEIDGVKSPEFTLELQQLSLGVDYALAASTTVYGYYSNIAWDWDFDTDGDVDGDATTFGVGIDHKF